VAVYLRFDVASEAYAVSIANAIEVAAFGQVVAIPRAPAQILGVQILHGDILPVVDLAAVLRLSRSTLPSRLLVAVAGDLRVGFAVDDVTGVAELPAQTEELEIAEGAGGRPAAGEFESPILTGAVLADGALIGIIDVARAIQAALAAGTDSMRAVLP
jgi:purine-binding chemotaxis protein CheW